MRIAMLFLSEGHGVFGGGAGGGPNEKHQETR